MEEVMRKFIRANADGLQELVLAAYSDGHKKGMITGSEAICNCIVKISDMAAFEGWPLQKLLYALKQLVEGSRVAGEEL